MNWINLAVDRDQKRSKHCNGLNGFRNRKQLFKKLEAIAIF